MSQITAWAAIQATYSVQTTMLLKAGTGEEEVLTSQLLLAVLSPLRQSISAWTYPAWTDKVKCLRRGNQASHIGPLQAT